MKENLKFSYDSEQLAVIKKNCKFYTGTKIINCKYFTQFAVCTVHTVQSTEGANYSIPNLLIIIGINCYQINLVVRHYCSVRKL